MMAGRSSGGGSLQRGNYKRHDSFFNKARQQGYVARSIYKLDEIQQREKLLRAGQRVLDLGCAPGAWLQLAAPIVAAKGCVVGVDLEAIRISLPSWVKCIQADIFTTDASLLLAELGGTCDVVLSDLAPHTTGIRNVDQARSVVLVERARDLAIETLHAGGAFIAKLFDGADTAALVQSLRGVFAQVRVLRPKATRTHSKEIYIISRDFKGS